MDPVSRPLHVSVGILGISGGSLLLLVNGYPSSPAKDFIPHTALGIALLLFALLLAYAGICCSPRSGRLLPALCLTVSGLWCGSGLVYVAAGRALLRDADLKGSLVPGLVAFTLALLVIAGAALIVNNVILCLIAAGVGLACAHQIAALSATGFGQSAAAANYLLVCLACGFFGFRRLLSNVTRGKVRFLGSSLKRRRGPRGEAPPGRVDAAASSLTMNLVSAAVLACPLLGVAPGPAVGHVPWLWTAGVFQVVTCVLFYRAMDAHSATFCAFTALLKFAEGYGALLCRYAIVPRLPFPLPVAFAALFLVLAVFGCRKSLLEGLYQSLFAVYCVVLAAGRGSFFHRPAQIVQAVIFVASGATLFIEAFNAVSTKKIPTGRGLFRASVARMKYLSLRPRDKELHRPQLGYSRYADAEALGFACSAVAAFAMTAAPRADPLRVLVLPWAVAAGGALQTLCGAISFSRGKVFESTAFTLHGAMWTVWGLTRFGGLYGETRGFNLAAGIVGFLLLNLWVAAAALVVSVAWCVYAVGFQLVLVSFLLDAVGALPGGYDEAVAAIFGLVGFYCFLARLFNGTFRSPQIPLGRPFIRLNGVGGGADACPHLPAHKASSVHRIAGIMKNGGICGVPSDTVYVLVAACHRPDAVTRAYRVKKQARDRPMSMWLASTKQLEPVRHLLSPLLLDFMEAAWPSSISMVIPRGPWMDAFGLGDAAKHIGTPQSIAIRNPDCSVTTYLADLVGPIAVTSANPTGEADTTHHNQVYAKLGKKVDGVLCDGPSPENIASTVVDCTQIETGHIGFFRVGVIPKSKVLGIFEDVWRRHRREFVNPAFTDNTGRPSSAEGDGGA